MSTYSTIISNINAGIPELDSKSVTSIFGKLAEAIAQVVDTTLAEQTNTKSIITDVVTNQSYGHDDYYTKAALAYQVGDDLSIDQYGNFYYATVNDQNKIITQAAFKATLVGLTTSMVLKVAATDASTGLLIPLTSLQLSDFNSYIGNFEIPGLPLTIVSEIGNLLVFNAAITYNKTYNLTTLQSNVLTALTNFKKDFAFNGLFFNYALENYLVTNVPGVTDVYLSGTTIDSISFSGNTPLDAGYFNYGAYSLNYGSL
jgi:hypothetical protein